MNDGHLLLVCSLALGTLACQPPHRCDEAALSAGLDALPSGEHPGPRTAAARQVLLDSCRLPEGLVDGGPAPEALAAWERACPAAPSLEGSVEEVWSACAPPPSDLGTLGQVVLAPGDPVRALATLGFLRAGGMEEGLALRAARELRGALAFELPEGHDARLPSGAFPPAPRGVPGLIVLREGVFQGERQLAALEQGRFAPSEPLGSGTYPRWALASLQGAAGPVAMDRELPVQTLRRVAASLAQPGQDLTLLVESSDPEARIGALSLRLPWRYVEDAPLLAREGGQLFLDGVALGEPGELAGRIEGPEIRLHVDDELPVQALVELAEAALAAGARPVLHMHESPPCATPPEGMVCVPGGPLDQPEPGVWISSFYVDRDEVPASAYQACVEAGACTEAAGSMEGAVAGVDNLQARAYCAWAGKRLPTRWEWDKAASAGLGLRDMDGGLAEWTSSWAAGDPVRCGEHCTGRDPRGPCQSAYPCDGQVRLVIRGGSGSGAEGAASPDSASHWSRSAGVGLRCASSSPVLTRFPPRRTLEPLPEPPPLEPPPAELLERFGRIQEDPVEDKPLCENEGGFAGTDCRDPYSYVRGNEPRGHLFRPYIRNLGGGYVGVASDQNYTYVGAARSEWAWFMDYDPNVVRVHLVNQALIKASPTPAEFVERYAPDAEEESLALIRAEFAHEPDRIPRLERHYRVFRPRLYAWYQDQLAPPRDSTGLGNTKVEAGPPDWGWLRNPASYQHLRTLFLQGRARAVKGDMLGTVTMREIGAAAREMGVPIRIYYTSNAPCAWGSELPLDHRLNVLALPMDDESVVMQVLGFKTGFGQDGYWHYHVSGGAEIQARLSRPGFHNMWPLVHERIPADDPDLTVMGLAGL